jgi:diguanylate cyclase (GGDEF)-like protein
MALARLATQLRVAGELGAAGDALEEAAAAADRDDDVALSCWFVMRRAEVLEALGDRDGALRLADAILARAHADNIPLAVADALSVSAALHATVGELVTAIEQAAEAVSVLAGMPEQPVTAVVYSNLARTYSVADMDERAVATLERALQLLEPTDHVHETAACMANLGAAQVAWALRLLAMEQNDLARERFAVATDPLRAALDIVERVPQPLVEARARARLALARAALGDSREALILARRAVSLADDVRAIEERVVARLALGNALDADGRPEEALSTLNDAYNLSREFGLESWRAVSLRLLGVVHRSRRDITSALDAMQQLDLLRNRQNDRDRWLRLARFEERRLLERTRATARDLRAENRQLSQMSIEDALTGLPNRWFLRDQLAPQLQVLASRGARVCVGLIDVDDFKAINDMRSYAMGDSVLQQVARLLHTSCREQDVVVRWGGDEFLVFLPETSLQEAETVGARFRSNVAEHSWNAIEVGQRVTVSGGLAVGAASLGLDALMAAANRYLHQSKEAAKNTVTVGAV